MPGLGALLLADGRFPAGGHAHSAGMEAAVADGRVRDLDTLASYLDGRVRTAGLVDAALAASAVLELVADVVDERPDPRHVRLGLLDAEADARIPAPPLRASSRKLGRQLVRVGGRCWPGVPVALAAALHPDGPHQSVALGAVGHAAGCSADEVAALAVHHTLTTPAQAAVRLLGLDPFGVAAAVAELGAVAAEVAAEAVAAALRSPDPADLPALSSPLVEVAAVEHRTWDMRLFAT